MTSGRRAPDARTAACATMIADTIFAPSTAPGRAGVAVVRISGPAAGAALRAVGGIKLPPPRRATLRTLLDPRDGQAIDRGLLLWFPDRKSTRLNSSH